MSQVAEKRISKDKIIRQANILTSAAYSLNKTEKRLVYIALDNISRQAVTPNKFGQIEIEIVHTQFAQLFSSHINNTSRDIASAAASLNTKEVVFYLPEEDGLDDRALDAISWTTKRAHRPKKGITTIHFNSELIDVITSVDRNYTRLLLGDIINLNSAGAMRLYDSLKQWERRGEVTFNINWMIERYELPTKYKSRTSDFRRRFLHPSIAEINEKTSMKVTAFEVKGRERVNKAHSVKFIIESNAPERVLLDSGNTPLEEAVNTYMILSEKSSLPSQQDIDNLKTHMAALLLDGFEFPKKLIESINQAEAANKAAASN
jgi:plasmid replication initiation protein